jgi:hypothetical protein
MKSRRKPNSYTKDDLKLKAELDYQWTSFNEVFTVRRIHAEDYRNQPWSLSRRQFYFYSQLPCYYCDRPPQQIFTASRQQNSYFPFRFNGLDRKNNNRGYDWQNVVPCCFQCNRAKAAITETEFYKWIALVHEHIKGRLEEDGEFSIP